MSDLCLLALFLLFYTFVYESLLDRLNILLKDLYNMYHPNILLKDLYNIYRPNILLRTKDANLLLEIVLECIKKLIKYFKYLKRLEGSL